MPLPLSDTSNILQQDRCGKRQRLESLQEPATFQLIVERAGINGLISSSRTDSHSQLQPPEADDPRQAKRQLAADLSTTAAREAFLSGLSDALADEELLHRCLLPITVTVQVSFATGDSFMRMLLNILPLQQQAATLLLQKLPEFSQTECDDTAAGTSGSTTSSVPGLILGQLRWLEQVADEAGLTGTVLEVLPVCSPGMQQQLIGLIPEIVLPQDHEVVIETLQGLLDQDLSFMAPVLDCFSNMQLEPQLQDSVLSSLLDQLAAVDVDDLPGLVKYLISSADKANADKVLTVIRSGLHFVSASDPRLAVPDHKQKGAKHPKSKSPEALLVKELVSALQGNEAATAACLQLVGAITEPRSHRCFDLLVLLALHAKAGNSRKSAEACLKKKLVDGHATSAWIHMSLQGHQASLCDLWHTLLSLAQSWSRAREESLTTASVQLYVDLFVGVDSSLERQQILQTLHGHLGSGVAGEQDVALQALSVLAHQHRPLLSQYSSHLANILDHLETFTNSQLQQVFSMFAALTAVQPAQAAGGSSASSAVAGGMGGTRLQDELIITLNKALAQNSAGYKRIGVVGNLALLRQSAADYDLMLSADAAAADQLLEEWMSRANAVFIQCQSHPGVLAFVLDQWSELLERQAGAGGGATMHMPKPMLDCLFDKANDLTNNAFLADLPRPESSLQASEDEAMPGPQPDISLDDNNLEAKLWFNLDGSYSPVYVRLLPHAVSKDPSKRAQLVWLPACLRLMAACLQHTADDLHSIDALLGCPLALPDPAIITDGRWDSLPLSSKVGVLLSLMHAICWLREVVVVFAPDLNAALKKAAQGVSTQTTVDKVADTQNKLLMRLSQLRVLEALFKHLAATCPGAAQQLPDVSVPLLMGTAGRTLSVAAVAAGKQDQLGKLESELMSKLRCLRPPAAFALNVCPDPRKQLTTLLPVTHLVLDLHAKLQLLVARARRPASFGPAASAPQLSQGLNGVVAIGGGGVSAATAGPPCLQSATLQQLVEQVLPLFPALQRHMCTALTVIRQPPADDREELFNGLPGWIPTSIDASIYGCTSIAQATEAMPAAMQLSLACMQCFTLLLKCTKELPAQQVRQVLAALAAEQPPTEDTVLLLRAAFKASRKFSCRSSGNSSLQLELAVLSLLQAITAVAAAEKAPADTLGVMSKRLSLTAEELLKCRWQQEDEAEEEHSSGFTWKGQTTPITQLLTVLISYAPDPSQQLLHLAEDVLKGVPGKVPGKDALNPYGGYSALSSATLATWYKVVFEQLVVCWEKLVAQGQQLIPTAASTARGARNTQQQKLNSQGILDWDDEQVDLMLTQAQRCCQAFSCLVQLTKPHHARKPLLAASVGHGGKFIEVLLKAMPLWRALYRNGYDAQFAALLQLVQKGTKVLQTVCNEAKAQRAGPLLSKAPAAKKSLERFVFEMKAFFHEAGQPDTFWMGNLKHRDLAGNTVGSQLNPADEDDNSGDDEDGADDEAVEPEQDDGAAEASVAG